MRLARQPRREAKPKQQSWWIFFKLGVVLVILMITVEVWLVNRLSSYGNEIEELSRMEGKIKLENHLLINEIAGRSSLSQVEKKAAGIGFSPIKTLVHIRE